jgi:hypothetical protein
VPIALVRGVTVAHRGRRAWAVLLLLLLAVVIVAALAFNLANLEPVGESRPVSGPGEEPSPVGVSLPPSFVAAVSWVMAVVVLAGLVLVSLRRRATKARPKPASWWTLVASVLTLVLLLALLASMPRPHLSDGNETAAADETGTESAPTLLSPAAGWPVELLLLITVFGSILWVLYRVRWGVGFSALSATDSSPANVRGAAVGVVQETIRDLEIGADVRTAIFACFQRFCHLLRSRGIADQDTLTPRELEVLAVRDLAISREASGTLTSLFEEARYSEHPLGDVERTRAIHSLERIRAALEA